MKEEKEMLTESEIVVRTGMPQATVHRILKSNLATMLFKQATKRVKLYDVRTLPESLKKSMGKKDEKGQ